MIISHDPKYVYIAVPKTGSISVSFSLGHGDNIPEPDFYHQGIDRVLTEHPEVTDYFKFGFVRNPWDRLASLYHDFTIKRVHQYSGLVRVDKPLFSEFADFEDFCCRVRETNWWSNVFLQSQCALLGTKMDFVGRFERLSADFTKVCGQLGIATSLLKMNVGEYHAAYRHHYTPKARDAVATIYGDDVEAFGYEF